MRLFSNPSPLLIRGREQSRLHKPQNGWLSKMVSVHVHMRSVSVSRQKRRVKMQRPQELHRCCKLNDGACRHNDIASGHLHQGCLSPHDVLPSFGYGTR